MYSLNGTKANLIQEINAKGGICSKDNRMSPQTHKKECSQVLEMDEHGRALETSVLFILHSVPSPCGRKWQVPTSPCLNLLYSSEQPDLRMDILGHNPKAPGKGIAFLKEPILIQSATDRAMLMFSGVSIWLLPLYLHVRVEEEQEPEGNRNHGEPQITTSSIFNIFTFQK